MEAHMGTFLCTKGKNRKGRQNLRNTKNFPCGGHRSTLWGWPESVGVRRGRALGEVRPESTQPGECGGQPARNCPCGGQGGCALG